MEEVLYVCLWYKDKKRTWSGTAWSLRQAMEHYITIRDFAISDPLYRKVLRKIQKKGLVPAPPLWDRLRMRACLGKREKIKTFQFGEFPTGDRYRSYIYQDLAVAAILWLMEHDPVSYGYCEYDGVAVEELKRRAASQLAAYRKSEAVFTMSRWLRDFLTEECGIPGEKVYAVGGGINVDAAGIRPGKKEGRRILFVGRNFLRKGGLLVVQAYSILKKKYLPEAELYLAGASAEGIRTALRDVGLPAEEKDLCGIHLLGDLTAEELAEYYNLCDVFCMPSYFEAYGLVFAEALTYGLPCIGRDKFAMREIIEDGCTGRLFSGEDAQELAEEMWEVLRDPKYRKKVEARKDRYLEEYSWDRVAQRIYSVMEQQDGT